MENTGYKKCLICGNVTPLMDDRGICKDCIEAALKYKEEKSKGIWSDYSSPSSPTDGTEQDYMEVMPLNSPVKGILVQDLIEGDKILVKITDKREEYLDKIISLNAIDEKKEPLPVPVIFRFLQPISETEEELYIYVEFENGLRARGVTVRNAKLKTLEEVLKEEEEVSSQSGSLNDLLLFFIVVLIVLAVIAIVVYM